MMKVLPQSFYESDDYQKVLRDGLSCVIYKKVKQTPLQKEGYVSTHALTLVLQGNLKLENINKGVAYVQANELIFVPKGLYTVSDILLSDEPFVSVVFFFDEPLIDEFIKSLNTKAREPKCVFNLVLPYSATIRLYTETLLKLYKNGTHNHHKVTRAKLFELLHLLSIGERGEDFIATLLSLKNKQKRNLKDFMNANFNKSLTVEDYAYLTGRSLSTFNRDFKRQFSVSPKKWLMDKRLDRAYELLSRDHQNVTEIAFEVGYENFSHFIKAFHKKFGISPKQFVIQRRIGALV
jgi:AraC family transcriptional regulator, exoenzyme S synthesis regulatory protein ExsA